MGNGVFLANSWLLNGGYRKPSVLLKLCFNLPPPPLRQMLSLWIKLGLPQEKDPERSEFIIWTMEVSRCTWPKVVLSELSFREVENICDANLKITFNTQCHCSSNMQTHLSWKKTWKLIMTSRRSHWFSGTTSSCQWKFIPSLASVLVNFVGTYTVKAVFQ